MDPTVMFSGASVRIQQKRHRYISFSRCFNDKPFESKGHRTPSGCSKGHHALTLSNRKKYMNRLNKQKRLFEDFCVLNEGQLETTRELLRATNLITPVSLIIRGRD